MTLDRISRHNCRNVSAVCFGLILVACTTSLDRAASTDPEVNGSVPTANTLKQAALDGEVGQAYRPSAVGQNLAIDQFEVSLAVEPCPVEREIYLPEGGTLHERYICAYRFSEANCTVMATTEEGGVVARCTFREKIRHKSFARRGYFECADLNEDLSCEMMWEYLGRRRP